jgi:hypothetical protein
LDAINGIKRGTHRLIILQHWPRKDKVPGLPPTEILTSFSQITLFMTGLHDRLTGLANDVGGEEGNDFVVVLDGQVYEGLEV